MTDAAHGEDDAVMERVDIGDWCTLYHADARRMYFPLAEHAPDAVITDPVWPNVSEGLIAKGTKRRRNCWRPFSTRRYPSP